MSMRTDTAPRSTERPTLLSRLQWLARPEVDGWVRATAWGNVVVNSLLVLTGGLVRLTGSGLGCPTWPRCTEESWTSTPEMGMHGVIEFGNRLLTFLVALVALMAFVAVFRMRRRHPDLFWLSLTVGLLVIVQALVGGLTVHTELNPWVVGFHFVVSTVMIALSMTLVCRARRLSLRSVAHAERPGQLTGGARGSLRVIALVVAVLAFVVIYVGTLVTGTGPHAGDAGPVSRHTFDPYWVTRLHTAPAYLLLVTAVGGLLLGLRDRWPSTLRRAYALLGAVLVVQGLIGYYQFFNGVPVAAVALHMVGAAVLAAITAVVVDRSFAVSRVPVAEIEKVSSGHRAAL